MGYRVAVVGATGNVGREMLNILEEVNFPVDKIHAIASRKSIGVEVSFGEKIVKCEDVEQFDFSTVDVVLMCGLGRVLQELVAEDRRPGPIVIDNSSACRMDPDVPLIVPEVNPDDVSLTRKKNIIANPNCSTAQLVVALKPLHEAARIKRVVVSTYQSVSGAGKEGMDELWNQTKGVFVLGAPEPGQVPQADRLQRHPLHRVVQRGRLHRRRSQDVERDPQDDRPVDQADGHLRPRAGDDRPLRGREHRVPQARSTTTRRATSCARAAGVMVIDKRDDDGLHHAQGSPGRVPGVRLAHPQRPDGRERPQPVGRGRQPAQGRGAERGADRRAAARARDDRAKIPA